MITTFKDATAKAMVAFVAAAMVFALFAPAVNAQTQSSEDLQKMINDLLGQIASLQSQVGQGGTTGGSMAAGVCPYTWTRDLSTGSTGMDVMKLQQFLNSDPDTRVAATGAGSPGMETEYFGPATAAAVSKMQVKYRAEVLSPAGLVNPTGFFGPSSRAKANSVCVAAPVTPGDDMDDEEGMEDEDEMENEDDNEGPVTLDGEASVDSFELSDGAEDEVEEGASDVAVGEITVEFEGGDAEISRLDLTLTNGSAEPWEAFETVSLWVDGDMVAEFDASDEANYLDEDDGEIRFSGLEIVAMEDEELEIVIGVTAQNNVDSNELGDWQFDVVEMRWFDADGVSDETDTDTTGDNAEFELTEEGEDESLDVSLSSDSPDSANIAVDSDSDTNGVTIMTMSLEAEESDVEINEVYVRVVTATTTTNVVDEAYLVLDGQTFKAEALKTDADDVNNYGSDELDAGGSAFANAGNNEVWYFFDVDGDVIIDAETEMDAEVVVDLNDTNDGARYTTGETIEAYVDTTELGVWDVEGVDPITPDGAAIGEEHTLVDEGLTFEVTDISAVRVAGTGNTPVDTAEFEVEVEVTAVGDTFYIEDDAATAFDFTVLRNGTTTTDVNGTSTGNGLSPILGASGVSKNGNRYRIDDGQTETFTFKVTVLPGGDAGARFRVQFDDVDFFTASTGGVATTQEFIPTEDFRTDEVTIVN